MSKRPSGCTRQALPERQRSHSLRAILLSFKNAVRSSAQWDESNNLSLNLSLTFPSLPPEIRRSLSSAFIMIFFFSSSSSRPSSSPSPHHQVSEVDFDLVPESELLRALHPHDAERIVDRVAEEYVRKGFGDHRVHVVVLDCIDSLFPARPATKVLSSDDDVVRISPAGLHKLRRVSLESIVSEELLVPGFLEKVCGYDVVRVDIVSELYSHSSL